ncbi:TadA family conjugal transfer-associated ATPase [Leifsonia sp. AG29]|uniref:TadA family conjugal transfer-associated ATPase n=1 Tax=Leifsonia sp. AG29 TaxID=2598860 RepID=UPI00131AF248|nr:TadA family conjugal transfer-associated ATPase [Leifsonia sp. AG29]
MAHTLPPTALTPSAAGPESVRPGLWATFGRLAPYLLRRGLTDLFITGSGELWCNGPDGLRHAPGETFDPAEARALAVALIARGGRHLDEVSPFVDVVLAGGVRVHAVLPPVSTGGALVSIRVPRNAAPSMRELLSARFLTVEQHDVLLRAVRERSNILISGPGGAGKTTLLGALLAEAPPTERIVLIEDVAELRVTHPHVVGLQTRQPNLEGAGGVDLRRLVREALRMRPDRLVLGECRGEEVRELLSALNTGHDGGAGTLHANSLVDVPARLEALGSLAGLGESALARQAVSALDLLVHLSRPSRGRRVEALGRPAIGASGRLVVEQVPV